MDELSLDKWLEDTLIPYLVQQFGEHPRFKGQPILLVRMHSDNVQPRIDELTDHIREKIIDSLVREPGLDLYWRPSINGYPDLGDHGKASRLRINWQR